MYLTWIDIWNNQCFSSIFLKTVSVLVCERVFFILMFMRPVVYQLFVRHFSNMDVDGEPWGSKERNGCGTFEGITREGLKDLVNMGITHIWLTGVLRHATRTSYPGLPAQEESIVKGLAGSPYAVTDYYDVDPDLAVDPEKRMDEFQRLIDRCHLVGLIPLIDYIPNHVSRAYKTLAEGKESFGEWDDTSVFFHRENSYYYLAQGVGEGVPPFKLPHGVWSQEIFNARVTGNNAATWRPSEHDWYETVKLNYGYNFLEGAGACCNLPDFLTWLPDVPKTWRMMDDVIKFWQAKGIGGFRCDMAQMVPMPFWKWLIARARVRDRGVFFIAEAYDDHMKTVWGDPVPELLGSGFSAIYDAPAYHLAHHIYEKGNWANDFDELNRSSNFLYRHGVRFIENHDEPRICAPLHWGGVGEKISKAMMTLLYASGKGPVLVYNGQEVGERAEGPGGYGGDNGRTSIFDYTCLPKLAQWVSYGAFEESNLPKDERELRDFHVMLLRLMQHPSLANGDFYGLNWSNMKTPSYGRGKGEKISGHWIYSFLKHDFVTRKTILVVCNLSPDKDYNNIQIHIPENALDWCGIRGEGVEFSPLMDEMSKLRKYDMESLVAGGFKCSVKAGNAEIYEINTGKQ